MMNKIMKNGKNITLLIGLLLLGIIGSFQEYPENTSISKLEKFVSNQGDSSILWNRNRKLTWNDFKGKPNYNEVFGANTNSFASISTKYFKDSIVILINNEFGIYYSWVKKDIQPSLLPLLLEHEQRHFDIGEIWVRKMRMKISKYISIDYKLTKEFIDKIFDEQDSMKWNMQLEYDKATVHGSNDNKQKEWSVKIDKMLDDLEAYSSPKVVIKRVGW